jgi:hypothetical protein
MCVHTDIVKAYQSLTLRVAFVLVTLTALQLKLATSLLFQFLYQPSDHLTTLQACSFISTTLCTVVGQLKHKKRA